MMRMNKTILMSLLFVSAVALMAVPAWAEESGYALLIQQSPPDAGSINLGTGVHKMGIGEVVTLSATAKPGYRFVYWLGDVASTDASATTIEVDSPKMVVAVFAREAFDDELITNGTDGISGGGGGGGQRGYINPVGTPAAISGGSNTEYPDYIYNWPDNGDGEEDDDIDTSPDLPVPGEGTDLPVPGGEEVPEPATVLLLGLGSAVLLRRKQV